MDSRVEAIGECVGDRVPNDVLVLWAKKTPQSIGVHDVLAGHVWNGFRRDR